MTLKGQGRDPDTYEADYLENSSREQVCVKGAPIENHYWETNGHVVDDVT